MIENLTIDLLYTCATSVTVAFISIIIPFFGALWIYKKNIKSKAELEIFALGREIGKLLYDSCKLKSPLWGISYSYIDKYIHLTNENNRDIGMHILLRVMVEHQMGWHELSNINKVEAAATIASIATERFDSLVPYGVKWSGKGNAYYPFGEPINTNDKPFPFGTKLYRQWIDRFSYLYNDIWICTENYNRRFFVDDLVSSNNISQFFSRKDINNWLDTMKEKINLIRHLHDKCVSQIQVIDHVVNEKYFLCNMIGSFFYIIILSFSGYFFPKIMHGLNLLTITNIVCFIFISLIIMYLIVLRILSSENFSNEMLDFRKIYIPKMLNKLSISDDLCLGYKNNYIKDFLSIKDKLKLPSIIVTKLNLCIKVIDEFNFYGNDLKKNIVTKLQEIDHLRIKSNDNKISFSIPIRLFYDKKTEFYDSLQRIRSEKITFEIEHKTQDSSLTIYSTDLSKLDNEQKDELCNKLIKIRNESSNLPLFESFLLIEKNLRYLMKDIEEKIKKIMIKERFDLIKSISEQL